MILPPLSRGAGETILHDLKNVDENQRSHAGIFLWETVGTPKKVGSMGGVVIEIFGPRVNMYFLRNPPKVA